ncbi:unnamed protein product [Didymodactylos carnosus]|uniref:ZZ-type domain-containing protein n=1 Tax=Didymodactylos carnosus TaxID=1234261 RepID=A0A816CK43_9BILA|nr:unnamed protein product [Didymodactylos carnosus]CAF4514843.1 unnamed protein product [Didymodactylos carnosus]
MHSTAADFFIPSSRISTDRRCDNCGDSIDLISWRQCKVCKLFDLCILCSQPGAIFVKGVYDKHKQLHKKIGVNESIKFIEFSEGFYQATPTEVVIEGRKRHFNYIVEQNKIQDDYDMYIVTAELIRMEKEGIKSSSLVRQLSLMMKDYHLQAFTKDIRILSLDGGGKQTK